jgi:hypothetical protein
MSPRPSTTRQTLCGAPDCQPVATCIRIPPTCRPPVSAAGACRSPVVKPGAPSRCGSWDNQLHNHPPPKRAGVCQGIGSYTGSLISKVIYWKAIPRFSISGPAEEPFLVLVTCRFSARHLTQGVLSPASCSPPSEGGAPCPSNDGFLALPL